MAPSEISLQAREIWQAGVRAVEPDRLVANKLFVDGPNLCVDNESFDLRPFKRVKLVGAGKASAALAISFLQRIWPKLREALPQLEISGWVNCPEGANAGMESLENVRLYAARPQGLNVPTQEAVYGSQQIQSILEKCDGEDFVVCLITGGASALLVSPREGISLEEKQYVAKRLASAGANIEQLNTVRSVISNVKAGGLLRTARAGSIASLIISDVLGDSLEIIGSGPTIPGVVPNAERALQVIDQLGLENDPQLRNVIHQLRDTDHQLRQGIPSSERCFGGQIKNIILGNNSDAVDAAGVKAVELGYAYAMEAATRAEGDVRELSGHCLKAIDMMATNDQVDCWISGGEPTVLLPNNPGRGGRNQQLTLAVLDSLAARRSEDSPLREQQFAFVSGGTDGEDGPTDAAGAWIDHQSVRRADELGLDLGEHLRAANAYPFFEKLDQLLKTGPTGTNVCDLRVAIVNQR